MNAFALDRLDDEGRNFARAEFVFECVEVVERDSGAVTEQRFKAVLEDVVTDQRERTKGQSMEGMFAGQDTGAPRCGAGNLIAASTDSVPELAKKTLSR